MKDARDYSCHRCAGSGLKLWRRYNQFLDHQRLLCAVCCGHESGEDVSTIDESGRRITEYGRTDQIGWWIPAVPTVEGDTFWGYASVPQDRVDWWRALPTTPEAPR